jgi:hypothetical protein
MLSRKQFLPLLFLLPIALHADIIYSDMNSGFGPASWQFGSSPLVETPPYGIAASFTIATHADTRYLLTSVVLALNGNANNTDDIVNVVLSAGALPGGTPIESFQVSVQNHLLTDPSTSFLYTITPSLNPVLDASTQYWIAVTPDDAHNNNFEWFWNNAGATGAAWMGPGLGPGWNAGSNTAPAFELDLVETPEPTSIAFLTTALLGIMLHRQYAPWPKGENTAAKHT